MTVGPGQRLLVSLNFILLSLFSLGPALPAPNKAYVDQLREPESRYRD